MAFDPQAIQDAIANAGSQLSEMWKRPGTLQAPENNLHPDSSALQFRIKVLEDRVALIENMIARATRKNPNG